MIWSYYKGCYNFGVVVLVNILVILVGIEWNGYFSGFGRNRGFVWYGWFDGKIWIF